MPAQVKPALAVIPARGGSKGLPGKNLLPAGGVPMLLRAINAVNEAHELVQRVVVSSDDPEILAFANRHGAYPVTRPPELARDDSAIIDAVKHAVAATHGENPPEIVLIVQPNVPIWRAGTVRAIVDIMLQPEYTGAVTAIEAPHPPEWLMRENNEGSLSFYMGDGNFPVNRQELTGRPLFIDGQVVAGRGAALAAAEARPLAFCGDRVKALVRERAYGTDVDDKWDLIAAEGYLRELACEKP